jgi:hypothetical protein
MKIKVYKPDEQDFHFYGIMGEYFADRRYADEMGGWQFYSKIGRTTWYLVLGDHGDLEGFCSLIEENTHYFLDNFYILKSCRNRGRGEKLLSYVLGENISKELRLITNNKWMIAKCFERALVMNGMRGKYTKFKRKFVK